jgi:ElaB/YqjD/DUF883 family membrane-anchored ribosome-binding protein
MAEGTAAPSARANDADDASTMKETVSEFTDNVKGKTSELAQKVIHTIDEQRETAASTLRDAATTLYVKADNLPTEAIKSVAQHTAEKMDRTSEYLRQHNASAVIEDIQQAVRRHPGRTVIMSLAVGFLLGRLFASD